MCSLSPHSGVLTGPGRPLLPAARLRSGRREADLQGGEVGEAEAGAGLRGAVAGRDGAVAARRERGAVAADEGEAAEPEAGELTRDEESEPLAQARDVQAARLLL